MTSSRRRESFARATEVLEGVWAIPMPFTSPLRHVYAYAVQHDDGVSLIDAGWDSNEAWNALTTGLDEAGIRVGEVRSLLVTHVHPDHYGLTERLQRETDLVVQMHGLEAKRIPRDPSGPDRAIEAMISWLQVVGAPGYEIDALRDDAPRIKSRYFAPHPDRLLEDGEVATLAGGIRAIHTPGHTPGHLCFVDPGRRVLFTGDHVLPRITPNVSKRPEMGADPLGCFVHSVRKVREMDVDLGLPGHEWPMENLQRRLDDLLHHHNERMGDVERAVCDGAETVWEVATTIRWSRPWSELRGLSRRSAIGEAHAHLERLTRDARLTRTCGIPDRWQIA